MQHDLFYISGAKLLKYKEVYLQEDASKWQKIFRSIR